MTRRPMQTISVDRVVDAPPSDVYEVIADIPRLPEWAMETSRCRWLGKADRAAPGAKFLGVNRHGWFRWFSVCQIVEAEPGRRLSWDVLRNIAHWESELTATEGGCRVTQRTTDRRGFVMQRIIGPVLTGVVNRSEHNQANMDLTLRALADRVRVGPG